MRANVGTVDRVVRLIVGLGLLSLVFVGPQTPWGLVGLILIATAAIKFCPLYRLLGIRTCKPAEGSAVGARNAAGGSTR
ncbi:MAG: DUF2892 domain-containing protein [Alphaproteobacteria bacterium]|nr:MAG: DUF2892 domain-containing protein [Alphaproteobacteria bacterium]